MKRPFRIQPHTGADKEFLICGPGFELIMDYPGFELIMDYDDVDHRAQDRAARLVVKILNANWGDHEDELNGWETL